MVCGLGPLLVLVTSEKLDALPAVTTGLFVTLFGGTITTAVALGRAVRRREENLAPQAKGAFPVVAVAQRGEAVLPLLDGSEESLVVAVEFTPTSDDEAEGIRAINQRAARRRAVAGSSGQAPTTKRSIRDALLGWVLLIGFVIMVVMGVQYDHQRRARANSASPPHAQKQTQAASAIRNGAFAVGGAGIAMFTFTMWNRIRQPRPVASAMRVRADRNGLSFKADGFEELLRWQCFTGLTETPNLIVLHQGDYQGRYVPKRVLASGTNVNDLRRLASAFMPTVDLHFP
jgi:hypothetical protein